MVTAPGGRAAMAAPHTAAVGAPHGYAGDMEPPRLTSGRTPGHPPLCLVAAGTKAGQHSQRLSGTVSGPLTSDKKLFNKSTERAFGEGNLGKLFTSVHAVCRWEQFSPELPEGQQEHACGRAPTRVHSQERRDCKGITLSGNKALKMLALIFYGNILLPLVVK